MNDSNTFSWFSYSRPGSKLLAKEIFTEPRHFFLGAQGKICHDHSGGFGRLGKMIRGVNCENLVRGWGLGQRFSMRH